MITGTTIFAGGQMPSAARDRILSAAYNLFPNTVSARWGLIRLLRVRAWRK